MATWDEIREHLRSKYKLLNDDAAWIGLGFAFERESKTLHQRVRVEPRSVHGLPGVMIWCDVLPADKVPPQKALVRNMAFPIGALAIHEDLYVLVAVLPLDGVAWASFDVIIESLARDAANLREDAPPAAS